MFLTELENKLIKPLPRLDKLRLIADITKMLQEEEESAEKFFRRRAVYPVMTPTITPDDSSYNVAFQLQKLWGDHNKA
jgi:hypothetical protein